jgi:hypothetical protein
MFGFRRCEKVTGFQSNLNAKNGVFWDVTPCGSVRTDVSEELRASIIRMARIGELGTTLALTSNRRTLVTAKVVSISLISVTLIMEALRSPETSVLPRATRSLQWDSEQRFGLQRIFRTIDHLATATQHLKSSFASLWPIFK